MTPCRRGPKGFYGSSNINALAQRSARPVAAVRAVAVVGRRPDAAQSSAESPTSPPAANQALSNENTNDAVSPFVVGVSGHRDLRPDALPHLRAAVTAILRQLAEPLPDTELRIVGGSATGAALRVRRTGP